MVWRSCDSYTEAWSVNFAVMISVCYVVVGGRLFSDVGHRANFVSFITCNLLAFILREMNV